MYKFNSAFGLSRSTPRFITGLQMRPCSSSKSPSQEIAGENIPFDRTKSLKVDQFNIESKKEGMVPGLPDLPLLKELQRCTVGPIGTYPDSETYRKWVLRPQLRVQLDEEVMNRPTHLMNGTKDKIGLYFALILTAYTTYLAYYIMWGLACPEKRLKLKEKYPSFIAP